MRLNVFTLCSLGDTAFMQYNSLASIHSNMEVNTLRLMLLEAPLILLTAAGERK